MKSKLRVLTVIAAAAASSATFAVPAFAATTTTALRGSLVADVLQQQQQDEKTTLYGKFYEEVQGKKETEAYATGQDYLKKYGTEKDTYTEYIRNWINDYDKRQKLGVYQNFYKAIYNDKNYGQAFTLGREVLAREPENLNVLISLSRAGYLANTANDKQFNNEAIGHTRKAIALLDSGKEPIELSPDNNVDDRYYPFTNKPDTMAFLNFALGDLTFANSPLEAARYYHKAASYDSFLKKEPSTYSNLAQAYLLDYNRLRADFERYYKDQPESDSSKAALSSLNQVIDRIIDANARVVSYSGTDAKYAAAKAAANEQLKSFYAFRKGSETGLPQYVASVVAQPLPEPINVTITAPPAAAPANGTVTPATGTTNGATPNGTPSTNATPAPATARPAATPTKPLATTTTTTTKPVAAKPAAASAKPQTAAPKAATTKAVTTNATARSKPRV